MSNRDTHSMYQRLVTKKQKKTLYANNLSKDWKKKVSQLKGTFNKDIITKISVAAPTKTIDPACSAASKAQDAQMKDKKTVPLQGVTVSSSRRSSQTLNEARDPQGEFDADESLEVVVAARKAKGGRKEAASATQATIGNKVEYEWLTKTVSYLSGHKGDAGDSQHARMQPLTRG